MVVAATMKPEKRKRISFAKDVECTENTSEAIQAHKKKKAKREEPKPSEPEQSNQTTEEAGTAEDAASDVWTAILAKSKSTGLNYEDSMKEFLLEKLHAVVEHPCDQTMLPNYAEFMKEMSVMFGKLHRYPKMISKFLICIRTEILDSLEQADASSEGVDWVKTILPSEFLELIAPSVSLLPISHVIDLWKTLHHNLDEESIKPLLDGTVRSSLRFYVPIVVELLAEFMSSIKVSDTSVPASQMEKIRELMNKTETDCLAKLGIGLTTHIKDPSLLSCFLKLAFTWAELEWMFLSYNPKYVACDKQSLNNLSWGISDKYVATLRESDSVFNLAVVHQYLAVDQWKSLADTVVEADHKPATALLIRLIIQKVKRLSLLLWNIETNTQSTTSEELKTVVRNHLRACATFLWLQQFDQTGQSISSSELREILPLATKTLELPEILDLASNIAKKLDSQIPMVSSDGVKAEDGAEKLSDVHVISTLGQNLVLCSSSLIQLTSVVVRRLGKMKLEKKFFKLLKSEIFTREGQVEILQRLIHEKTNDEENNAMTRFLDAVNEFLSEHENCPVASSEKAEFSSDLIQHLLGFLLQLSIEELPKEIKAFLCLFAIPIFIGVTSVISSGDHVILKLATNLVFQSGSNARGNPVLFRVAWAKFIGWLSVNVELLSLEATKKVLWTALKNIYVSAKCIEDFEPFLEQLCSNFRLDAASGDVAILTAEFLTEELKEAVAAKSKLATVIRSNLHKLAKVFEGQLQKAPQFDSSFVQATEDGEMREVQTLSRTFRACSLLKALPKLLNSEEQPSATINFNYSSLTEILPQHVEAALSFLRKYRKKKSLKKLVEQSPELNYAREIALEFVLSVCESEKETSGGLPDDFISRLWDYCYKVDSNSPVVDSLILRLYQISSTDDFKGMMDGVVEDVHALSAAELPVGKQLARVTRLVDKLVDADLAAEKKTIRWNVMEEYLLGFLNTTLHWKDYDEMEYFPVLDLQLKILRRRNAISKLDLLANCFMSILSTPLGTITDASKFKAAFCKTAELLNAFVIHRLDVVSFRTPLVLQCFEHLVGSLTLKADQKNKLTDAEILELRYCAHGIERICQSTKLGQKEFTRISPYFLAIMMRKVDACVIYPAIKVPLMNGCYKLLDICDDHGVAQLNSMLSAGAREIFKVTYDLYKKYYRYTGKV